MGRVIIFSYEEVFPKYGSSGPSIRNWEIAKALTRKGHKITIAENGRAALKTKFIDLAKTKSTGPSGPKGGDLGTFAKGQMVPEFSKAVWALENGQMTMVPVKTQFGYHVIYLETKSEAAATPYEQVKDKIITSLKQQQFSAKITQVAKELKSKAKIVETATETNTTKK